MNYYFLVEGQETEMLFYPKLMQYLFPSYSRIYDVADYNSNNFFVHYGGGNPHIFSTADKSIADIKDFNLSNKRKKIKIDIMFIIIDSDCYKTYNDAEKSLNNYIKRHLTEIKAAKIIVIPIIQRECIESWFLGNPNLFPNKYSNKLKKYIDYYDVSINDPELMGKPDWTEKSKGKFAFSYLQQMCWEKSLYYEKDDIDLITTFDDIIAMRDRGILKKQLNSFISFIETLNKYSKLKSIK